MKTITIIGSGLSGTLLTTNLLKNYKSSAKLHINLIERDDSKLNLGVAYSTRESSHLLNVRAGAMSLFQDDPFHFYEWLKSNRYNYLKDDFVPRKVYGQYLKKCYDEAVREKVNNLSIDVILEEVVDIENFQNCWKVSLSNGNTIDSELVILSLGHISPSEIEVPLDTHIDRYFRTPWQDIYSKISPSETVFLIGSGLTATDVILSLNERDHRGKILSLSRRGQLSLTHQSHDTYPDFYNEIQGGDINQIFHVVKKHLKISKDPRSVTDSLRKWTSIIWKDLSETCKSRFLRHLQSRWNSIRHRMPEQSGKVIEKMKQNQNLEYLTGKILSITQVDNKILVKWQSKDGLLNETWCDVVVNCIGPESNYKRIKMPLIQNLIQKKIVCPEKLSIKTSNFQVISGLDSQNQNLFAIGPLLKSELYESTAVPEIRVQCEKLSKIIIKNYLN